LENYTVEKMTPSEKEVASEKNNTQTWSLQERESLRTRYGCEILKHNCTLEEAKVTNVPKDAYIVTYVLNGKLCYDLTRSGKRVSVFDMYYDTMGNVILSIEWGYGKINPRLWGYKSPEKKKRK